MEEVWKPVAISGWEHRYEVSNLGNVRSLDWQRPNPLTKGVSQMKGRTLTAVDIGNGYFRSFVAGKHRFVHRLVCEAFHGPAPEGKPLVLHGDGDPSNNAANNLRWGSHAENEQDKKDHGRNPWVNRTHCPKGHPYSESNTRVSKTGYRTCKECSRIASQRKRDNGLPPDDSRHGTNHGYLTFKCRCEPCKTAGHAYSAARPKKPRKRPSTEDRAAEFLSLEGRFPSVVSPLKDERNLYRCIYGAMKRGSPWAVEMWAKYRGQELANRRLMR